MLLDLTSDQEFFRQTTAKFLESQVPIEAVRALRDDPAGYGADYWRRGAELGWASLLVSEELGGGTISGGALVDLTLIAHEFGQHAAPGPLVPVNVVAFALSETAQSHPDVLESLMSGESDRVVGLRRARHQPRPRRRAPVDRASTGGEGSSSERREAAGRGRRAGEPPARHRPHR